MQFQVPQFIDTEPKIFGPLTVKQLIYCSVGGGIITVLFFVLNFAIWIFFAVIIGGLVMGVAFFKYNGRGMPELMKAIFGYFWNPRFYLWQREEPGVKAVKMPKIPSSTSSMGGLKGLVFKLTTSTEAITKREMNLNFSSLLAKLPHGGQEKSEILRKTTGEREETRRVDYR